jgi:hypothetical protein
MLGFKGIVGGFSQIYGENAQIRMGMIQSKMMQQNGPIPSNA